MEKQTKTLFVVEIGSASLYFDNLGHASEFFAKLVSSPLRKIGRLGYGVDSYSYEDGKYMPTLKQEVLSIYPNRKSAEFAKHSDEENEKNHE